MNKLMVVLLAFLQFGDLAEAADFYSYIPFLYKIPEGSVGIFRNGNQFYNNIYPAGVYPIWPSDDGFDISIKPEKVAVTEVSCITVEGLKITFPEITVHYQVYEDGVFDLVETQGIDFVKPLINNPVRQGVAYLCSTMTAEAVYRDKFAVLKQSINDYLTKVQDDQGSGLTIGELVINRSCVPDEIIEHYTGQNPSSHTGDQPYEIFYTLEEDQAARSRLCAMDKLDESAQHSFPDDDIIDDDIIDDDITDDDITDDDITDDDISRVVDTGLVINGELSNEPEIPREAISENHLQSAYKAPSETQQGGDPFMDGQVVYDVVLEVLELEEVTAESSETSRYWVEDNLEDETVHIESADNPDCKSGNNLTQLEQGDTLSPQDRSKNNLYQHMQDSQGLWKNNNNRLYLAW